MYTRNQRLLSTAVLAGALGLAGCISTTQFQLVVDPSLATAEVFEVDGLVNHLWKKPIRFGPFHTEEIHLDEKSWDWTRSGSTFWADVEEGTETDLKRFVFVGETGERWQVACRSTTPVAHWQNGKNEGWDATGKTRRGCVLRDPAGTDHSLTIHGSVQDLSAEAQFGDAEIDVRGLRQVSSRDGASYTIPAPLGFELRQGGHVIASVDLLGKGRVYLARETPAELRDRAAMTATVFMLIFKS